MAWSLERKERSVSTSAFFKPASSPISMIQYPCSFSAAVLSFVSLKFRLSENQSPASREMSVLFPTPAIAEQAGSLKEWGINATLFWAYRNSITAGNDQIDFSETIWDTEVFDCGSL